MVLIDYILTGFVRHNMSAAKAGICTIYDLKDMEGDHITPWTQGGKTVEDNLQMLCKQHNRTKSDK